MHAILTTTIYYLTLPQTFSFTLLPPPTRINKHQPLNSLVSDSSDYKDSKSEEPPSTSDDSSPSGYRSEDDMAYAPTKEEVPVPMSRNDVGSRWVAIVMDNELYGGYGGEIWEGESLVPVDSFDDQEEEEEEEEEEEDYEEEAIVQHDPEIEVTMPEFKQQEPKRTAFDPHNLQILEANDQETIWEEYDNDHILWKMHYDRIRLTEDHVMWARKQNLYNETFNTQSMADVRWSYQILSSDLQRAIGHVMCLDSPTLDHCREALSRDPIIQSLLGVDEKTGKCDVSSIPLYRWRHIRDYTLRRDDGRDGKPTILLAFDHPNASGVREENYNKHLEYMIRSERIIAAGPLHVATEEKMDPKSIPVGTLMLFNAKNRNHAIEFVENDPFALEGLYDTMTVNSYNQLDVTGKFVSENLYFGDRETSQMKEAMEYWGYPVDDDQTKWLNW